MMSEGATAGPRPAGDWSGELERQARELAERGMIDEAGASALASFAEQVGRIAGRPEAGGGEVTVTSAIPLADEERRAVEERLQRRFGNGLRFRYRVDGEIIGGLVVRVGDRVVDGSVSGKLDALKRSMLASID